MATDLLSRFGDTYGFSLLKHNKPGRAEHIDLKAIFGETTQRMPSELEVQGLKNSFAIGTGTDALLNEWACALPVLSQEVRTPLGFGQCVGDALASLRQAAKAAPDPAAALELRRGAQELAAFLSDHELAWATAHQLQQG
jgi:hypothetical protein